MQPALLIRLRPTGAWRYGPGEGGHDRLDALYRSDRVYSAVTLALRQLGFLDEWLEATARASSPAVAFSSLFPFQADVLFAPPPSTLWPPPTSLVSAPSPVFLIKIRWEAARFVPVTAVEGILMGQSILADQWLVDAESGCLLRRDRPSSSPFRVAARSGAAVDRLTHSAVQIDSSACVEFEAGSGLWNMVRFADSAAESTWSHRLQAAFRLLADTGFGARRSSGWGRAETPEFQSGSWPGLLMPKLSRASHAGDSGPLLYWLLSLYSPSLNDAVDWKGGDYRLIVRGGRIEAPAAMAQVKKSVRMVSEGSVLAASTEPIGSAIDVAPEGFPHPVYRSGLALTLKLPTFAPEQAQTTAEPEESSHEI
ncbi:MAG: hypothetical protein WB992_16295 [Bryobacteraceae bacterium]